jgi:uncharacterized protein YyaL (SSP411 family)
MAGASPHTNRLAKETSPYLLQHQHNPVDWYPWGNEAFETARRENKPIFLSVGYSTCYWCHVMERQCFENASIAGEMNKRFVNIKVDREERPDVDQLYMTAVQVLTRHGGWPMSVFLTPDLRPFYGGTYFPPEDAHGRPGFVTVLTAIEDAYHNRRPDVDQSTDQLVNILQQLAEPAPSKSAMTIDDDFIESLIDRSTADYDPTLGGFGGAPKFPRETLLELMLVHNHRAPDERRMKMLTHTLDAMAMGGIRDQLGGGFHRYSTDAQWLVPHFEIMLYDNAMLAWIYVEAYRQTEDRRFAQVARGILDFIEREMTSPKGAFYTAFDAEVDTREGLSYLWTRQEIESILGSADAAIFCRVYGVDRGPNFADPHHGDGAPDQNILYLPEPVEKTGVHPVKLEEMRLRLLEVRQERKQPLLDTKIITSWNALMIRAFAHAARVLQEERYVHAAADAADYLLRHHRMADGGLYRASRDGQCKYAGFLDDYAFFIQALIALRDVTGREEWKDHALMLAMIMEEKFGDARKGGYYFTERGASDLIVRQKIGGDSPLSSGNGVAALVMMELDQPESARRVLELFASPMQQNGEGMSALVQAADQYVGRFEPIPVAAAPDDRPKAPPTPEEMSQGIVTLTTKWRSRTELEIRLQILDGFHLNAHETRPELIATHLTVDGATEIEYPRPHPFDTVFAESSIPVYSGSAALLARFATPPASGSSICVTLRYQPCDETACLPAVTKQLMVRA